MMKVGVFDVEADGLLEEASRAWCFSVKDLGSDAVLSHRVHSRRDIIDPLASYDVLIGHNAIAYDFPLLKRLYNWEFKGKVVDTLLMSRLQRPNLKSHSVEAWGKRLGRSKPEHEDWSQYSPEMLHRCEEDVEIQHLIFKELMGDKGWRDANLLTFKLFTILQKQEERGWKVDQEWLDHSLHTLDRWMGKVDRAVAPHLPMVYEVLENKNKGVYNWVKKPYLKSGRPSASLSTWLDADVSTCDPSVVGGPFARLCYRPVDLDKPLEVKRFLLDEGWIPDSWNTDSEGNRTSPKLKKDDSFVGITSSIGKIITKRLQCKHRKSTLEGWKEKIREDGSIPTPVGGLAVTRRLMHKSVVNVPNADAFFGKHMRKVFTVRDGWTIVGIDSSGCQNRMLGARVGNEEYTHTLLHGNKGEGTAIHQLNQRAIERAIGRGITYGNSKNINYAFLFGARDPKLGSIIGEGGAVGKKIREAMLSVAPGFEDLLDGLTKEWRSHAGRRAGKWGVEYYNGWIAGLDGRPIYIPYEYQILVYLLQSDEAIMMTKAYTMMYDRMTERGYRWGEDWAYLIFYHDEYNIECRPQISQEVAELGAQCITDAGEFYNIACPHEGEAKIGSNWYEVH